MYYKALRPLLGRYTNHKDSHISPKTDMEEGICGGTTSAMQRHMINSAASSRLQTGTGRDIWPTHKAHARMENNKTGSSSGRCLVLDLIREMSTPPVPE